MVETSALDLERSTKGSPELTAFSQLMRDFLSFRPEKDGYRVIWQADTFLQNYPYSPVSSNVDVIKADSQKRADAWFGAFFVQSTNLPRKRSSRTRWTCFRLYLQTSLVQTKCRK